MKLGILSQTKWIGISINYHISTVERLYRLFRDVSMTLENTKGVSRRQKWARNQSFFGMLIDLGYIVYLGVELNVFADIGGYIPLFILLPLLMCIRLTIIVFVYRLAFPSLIVRVMFLLATLLLLVGHNDIRDDIATLKFSFDKALIEECAKKGVKIPHSNSIISICLTLRDRYSQDLTVRQIVYDSSDELAKSDLTHSNEWKSAALKFYSFQEDDFVTEMKLSSKHIYRVRFTPRR